MMNTFTGPILVVEDIQNVLELLEVTLRFKGYRVLTARNGQEALDVISREMPVLVITDILMPRMDGFALAQKLRVTPETRHIPIMFLSATYVTPEDKSFALSLGAISFMEKPVDTEEFLISVGEILTQGPRVVPEPLSQRKFYQGYCERLEGKLHHKNTQIARTERLLQTLPAEQRPAFEVMLLEARRHREEIQRELNTLYKLLENTKNETYTK